ncbi:hypothetical protein ACLBWZ_17125 [Brucellaceae bacterium C25G]
MIKFGKVIVLAATVSAATVGFATAATVTNSDSAAQTIIVTEGASKQELVVAPGDTVSFCPSGCFVTMPNGDREALNGGEALTISGSKVQIK